MTQDLLQVADWIADHTPEDAVVLADSAPIYELLTGRRVYRYRFSKSPDLLDHYQPDFVVLDARPKSLAALERRTRALAVETWALPTRRPAKRMLAARLAEARATQAE